MKPTQQTAVEHEHKIADEEEETYPKSNYMKITASPLSNRARLSAREVNAALTAQPEYRKLFANVAEYNAILDDNGITSNNPPPRLKTTSSGRRLIVTNGNDDDGEELTAEMLNDMFDHDCRVVQYIRDGGVSEQHNKWSFVYYCYYYYNYYYDCYYSIKDTADEIGVGAQQRRECVLEIMRAHARGQNGSKLPWCNF